MGGLFNMPRVAKPPPVLPPPAIPDVGEEPGEIARRKRPRGRQETFLTGDLIPETGKKRVLG
ncbi:MAG: hypothetical protein KAS32_07760 [Candidatus Peribacteraceae bacterium]|nr:hypothetical protein [Candidatus Peribacteraceae bacterium]